MPKSSHLIAAAAALHVLAGCARHDDAARAVATPRTTPHTGVIAALRPAVADSPARAAILRVLGPAPGGGAQAALTGELIVRVSGGATLSVVRGDDGLRLGGPIAVADAETGG